MRPAVLGGDEDLLLAGLNGNDPADADIVVTLGAPTRPDGAELWIDWPADPGAAGAERPDRLIATHGDGLWRREPWPVADAVFELEPPPGEARVLVVGGDEERRGRWAEAIGRYAPATGAERLTLSALRDAPLVAVASERLPTAAFAVLAARRVLITARLETGFGLLAGVDHFEADGEDEAAQLAGAALARPGALRGIVELGSLAAERRRASVVYPRLIEDLRLEGTLTG